MSSFGGLIKSTSYWNRVQQKRDWQKILSLIQDKPDAPDWSKSVKKIDAYMESVCKKYSLNHMDIFGNG